MIGLYRIATDLVHALVYPYGRQRAAAGKELWRGRLGLIPHIGPIDIWVHAASVGEVKVVGYLIDYLRKKNRSLSIHLSVMTEAGLKTGIEQLDPEVTVSYFPLDAVRVVTGTLDRLQPRMIVIAETEIWPNLIRVAGRRRIPLILVNGRMSSKAFARYRMVKGTIVKLLRMYDRFFLKTEGDRMRYAFFGAPSEKLQVAGDMKFDAPLLARSEGRVKEIRARASVRPDQYLLVAGSTRPGEEEQLVSIYCALKEKYPKLRLILAPRHVQRVGEIEALLESRNIPYYRYGGASVEDGLILVDKVGILVDLYMAADLAFVGGSLVDLGGHNLLEPVSAGTPVLFGPYVSNVREAADYIREHRYGAGVGSVEELRETVSAALEGRIRFEMKTKADIRQSPAALAGDYILRTLSRA